MKRGLVEYLKRLARRLAREEERKQAALLPPQYPPGDPLSLNLDGGEPDSNYGGINPFDAGEI
jgi:hypothetical protein